MRRLVAEMLDRADTLLMRRCGPYRRWRVRRDVAAVRELAAALRTAPTP